MNKYDYLILEIIHNHKIESKGKTGIKLKELEGVFWKEVESNHALNLGQGRVGERIAQLYMGNYIKIKGGYALTGKGRRQLEPVE